MRGLFVGLGALVALACGGDFSDVPRGAAGRGGNGGAGRVGAGGGGRQGMGETGGTGGAGVSGRAGSTAGTGTAGRVAESAGQCGEGNETAGATSGEAGAHEEAGMGGQPSSSGAKGGSGGAAGTAGAAGASTTCDCDAAHVCVEGECVIKPECDCDALTVACSPLSTAMGSDFSCPIEVQCGLCEAGELCVAPGDPMKFGRRICHAPTSTFCKPEPDTLGCAQSPGCGTQYSECSEPVLPSTGAYCPTLGGPVGWWCGPPL